MLSPLSRSPLTLLVAALMLSTASYASFGARASAQADAEPAPASDGTGDTSTASAEAEEERPFNPLFDDPPPRPRPARVYTEEDEDFATLPDPVDPWVIQFAARTGLGLGLAFGDLPRELVFDSHLRAELFFTKRGDEHFSIGPSMELRGANFDTFEVAAGISALLPVARGYPIDISAQVGYAVRRGQSLGGSAPIFVATVAGGYRSFNFHHWWQTSLQLYAQVRMDLTEPRNLQFMMGVEIDLVQAVAVPAMMILSKLRSGDPDELEEDEVVGGDE